MIFLDPSYLLVMLVAMALTGAAQFYVRSTFSRYSEVQTMTGRSGAEVARRVLDVNGLHEVAIEEIPGNLTDHYDPRAKVLRLSQPVAEGRSLSSVGVAAHEAGHALQDARHYAPLAIRSGVLPVANLGSSLALPLIFAGLFLRVGGLITIGALFFAGFVAFQLVTLPVEFNASRRAVATLTDMGEITPDESRGVRSVLNAAALTYLAAALVALLQLIYFVMLGRRSR